MCDFHLFCLVTSNSSIFGIVHTFIKRYGLISQTPSQFENISKVLMTESKTSEHVNKCSGCQPKEDLLPSRSVTKGQLLISQF